MRLRGIGIVVVFFLLGCGTASKKALEDKPKKVQITRTAEEVERDNLARKCLAEYQFAQTLLDANGKVSQKAINRFENIFASNAQVLNDIYPEPSLIYYKDYVSNIYSFMREEGVKASIVYYYDFGLVETTPDLETNDIELEYYGYVFPVKKRMLNGLNYNNEVVKYPNERFIDLEIVIIASTIVNKAKILLIRER